MGSTSVKQSHLASLVLHKQILKVSTNADTTVRNVYANKTAWNLEIVKTNKCIRHRLPLKRHIAKFVTFTVDPSILLSLYESAICTQPWLVITAWYLHLSKIHVVQVKLGPLGVAAILFLNHSYNIMCSVLMHMHTHCMCIKNKVRSQNWLVLLQCSFLLIIFTTVVLSNDILCIKFSVLICLC